MSKIFDFASRHKRNIWYRYGRYAHLNVSQGESHGFETTFLDGNMRTEMTMCGKVKPTSRDNLSIEKTKKCKACEKFLLLEELAE